MAIQLVSKTVAKGASRIASCRILGITLRTLQRWEKGGHDKRTTVNKTPHNKLTPQERSQVIALAISPEFSQLSPKQIVPTLADKGCYIASESSMYRILREEKMINHRGRSAKPMMPPVKPQGYQATAANQVWCWDITYCASAVRGQFYYLYMMMDVYSRQVVGWEVHEKESAEYAATLMRKACMAEGIQAKQIVLHSDNGSPMKGSTMLATLQALGVTPSFSRPSVSNDNPYSESLFKTLKYVPHYPAKPFVNLEAVRSWCLTFVRWYNHEHKHSSLKYVTPHQRHTSEDINLLKKRANVYEKAKKKHPERWSKEIRNWCHEKVVWLNPSQTSNASEIQVKKAV